MNTKVSSSRFVLEIFSTWILLMPLSILNGILIARMLGPSGKGIFALVKIWSSYPIFLLTLGFPTGVLYYLSSEKYDIEQIATTSILISMLSGMILSILVYLIWRFRLAKGAYSHLTTIEILFMTVIIIINSILGIVNRLVRGIGWFRVMNLMNFLKSISLFLFLIFFLLVLKKGVVGALAALLLSQLSVLLAVIGKFIGKIKVEPVIDIKFAIKAIKYGIKAYPANLANISTQRIDQFILSLYVKSSDLGYYSVAATLSELPWIIARSLNPVFFKKVAMYKQLEKIILTNRVVKSVLIIQGTIYLFLFIFGGFIITLLYGERFAFSGILLRIYLPGALGYVLVSIIAKYFLAIDKPQIASYVQIIGGTFGVILYLFFIKYFGIIGAAVASSLTYLTTASLSIYTYKKSIAPQKLRIFNICHEDIEWLKSKLKEIVKG